MSHSLAGANSQMQAQASSFLLSRAGQGSCLAESGGPRRPPSAGASASASASPSRARREGHRKGRHRRRHSGGSRHFRNEHSELAGSGAQSGKAARLHVRRTLQVKIKKSRPILGIAIEGGVNVSGQLVPRIVCVHVSAQFLWFPFASCSGPTLWRSSEVCCFWKHAEQNHR